RGTPSGGRSIAEGPGGGVGCGATHGRRGECDGLSNDWTRRRDGEVDGEGRRRWWRRVCELDGLRDGGARRGKVAGGRGELRPNVFRVIYDAMEHHRAGERAVRVRRGELANLGFVRPRSLVPRPLQGDGLVRDPGAVPGKSSVDRDGRLGPRGIRACREGEGCLKC